MRADLESVFLELTEGEQLGGGIAWPSTGWPGSELTPARWRSS